MGQPMRGPDSDTADHGSADSRERPTELETKKKFQPQRQFQDFQPHCLTQNLWLRYGKNATAKLVIGSAKIETLKLHNDRKKKKPAGTDASTKTLNPNLLLFSG